MKIKILTFLSICLLSSCMLTSNSDFEKGKKQLEQQGYVDIQDTGYDFFCCSYPTLYRLPELTIVKDDIGFRLLQSNHSDKTFIKTVHKLQNIYFILTDKELCLK